MKRKTGKDAAATSNMTPSESLPADEARRQFHAENPAKGFNRNSKHGLQGNGKE
ncbi:hypothetical protein [Metabacillus lacus]|uniref:hypothetical protein n=1 Tax=Metabacillus lacus TaxID=1983721 RepID=UPI001478BFE1|nr:hypothetical protein [Metabacillus lacus]